MLGTGNRNSKNGLKVPSFFGVLSQEEGAVGEEGGNSQVEQRANGWAEPQPQRHSLLNQEFSQPGVVRERSRHTKVQND